MSKKEKLQEKIAKLQAELHEIEVKEWWAARPHILEFKCVVSSNYNDEGGHYNNFYPSHIKLNEDWLYANLAKWESFCNSYNINMYPDDDGSVDDDYDYYMRDINASHWCYEYPNFTDYDNETMRNPNYAG